MTSAEAKMLLQEIGYGYPNFFVPSNETELQGKIEFYRARLDKFEYTDVINGFYNYVENTSDKYAPSIKQLKEFAELAKRKRLNKQGKATRRIVTPEEDMANEYIEIMNRAKKRGSMTDEEDRQVHILLPYYEMFFGPHKDELYLKHFGKSREEFERLD